jgi:thioredoxin domain-containing protein 5
MFQGADRTKYEGDINAEDVKEDLIRFVNKVIKSEQPRSVANPIGQVLELSRESFATTRSTGPMFVKFFAPWCGHCKKLAPTWKQLARHMQNKLTIAEVNCDVHGSLCKSHNVEGYPTLLYFPEDGPGIEYNGGRGVEQLKLFAENATAG